MSKNTSLSALINYISANSSGNVVIAAPSSGFALDVTGSGRFTGAVTFGSTIGNGTYTYTLPSSTGTLVLSSQLSSYVPTSRTLTINGTAFDLSSDRSWTVSGSDNTKLPLAGGTLTGTVFVNGGYSFVSSGLNNSGGFAMNNSGTYWGLMWNFAINDWRLGRGSQTAQNGWNLRWDSGNNVFINQHLYLNNNYGSTIVGVYESTRYQGVFAMGDAYKLPLDGTGPGNLYGLAWSHPNAGGQAARLNNHGLLVMINGSTAAAISSNIWASGSINAVTDMGATEIRASGWLRTTGSGGVYYEAYGQGIRASKVSTSYGNVETYGENFNGYGGYHIVNNYYTCTMQNTSGTIGWYQQNGNGWLVFWNNGYTCLGVGTDATDPSYSLHIPKYGGSNTGWIIWSDRRIKENIKTIDNALDKVLSLRGVYYNKIDDSKKERQVGYIAQEVMEVVPELVVYSEELDIYNMNYAPMVSLITEAMKEQQAQIDALKEQVQTLLNNINNGI